MDVGFNSSVSFFISYLALSSSSFSVTIILTLTSLTLQSLYMFPDGCVWNWWAFTAILVATILTPTDFAARVVQFSAFLLCPFSNLQSFTDAISNKSARFMIRHWTLQQDLERVAAEYFAQCMIYSKGMSLFPLSCLALDGTIETTHPPTNYDCLCLAVRFLKLLCKVFWTCSLLRWKHWQVFLSVVFFRLFTFFALASRILSVSEFCMTQLCNLVLNIIIPVLFLWRVRCFQLIMLISLQLYAVCVQHEIKGILPCWSE